ncbi:Phosphatidylethanolamine N-methyltransferase [Lamellibrachia satsuma]|nr:Phosphatidylethanolamine N-methyltransferase [Lamellibrachia satsuma]
MKLTPSLVLCVSTRPQSGDNCSAKEEVNPFLGALCQHPSPEWSQLLCQGRSTQQQQQQQQQRQQQNKLYLATDRYLAALRSQTRWIALQQNAILWLGYFLILLGGSLNLCTLGSLGIRGAYLGEYFGFLLPRKVQSFPFHIVEHSFYVGTVLLYLGIALVSASQAGLLLTLLLAIVYRITLLYEKPYMEDLYRPQQRVTRVTDEIHWQTVDTTLS